MILKSDQNYVPYQDLVFKLGEKKVDQMIERSLLYYRPVSGFRNKFIRDILPVPNFGTVTASGVPALLAMQILVDRFQASIEAGTDNGY